MTSTLNFLGQQLAREEVRAARALVATPIAWRRCGWCHAILGVIALEVPTPGMFTDTCCPDCRVRFFSRAVAKVAA